LAQVVDDVLKVAQRASEPINPSDYQRVTLAKELKQRRQALTPVSGNAGHTDVMGSRRANFALQPNHSRRV
jgi:hypothetical protein